MFFIIFFLFSSSVLGFVIQIDENSYGQIVKIRWPESQAREGVTFRVDTNSFPFPESDVVRIVQNSFKAWELVDISFIVFKNQGTGNFRATTTDKRNVILYDKTGREIGSPPGTGVIAATRVNWNDRGEMIDADIILNGRDFQFSVDPISTPRGKVDLQDVLTHEVGHFLGLDHTPLVGLPAVRPTMNPFNTMGSPRESRSLEPDDMGGAMALYPSSQATKTGRISGRITHPDGQGAFGVHVVAYRAGTEVFLVSSLSGSVGSRIGRVGTGEFEIVGLPPGDYQVGIEPLTGMVTQKNLGGIFHKGVDTKFPQEFYDNVAMQKVAQTIRVNAGRVVDDVDFTLGMAIPGSPFIRDPLLPVNTPSDGPYRIQARITDDDGLVSIQLEYRINHGDLKTTNFERENGDIFIGSLPGQDPGSVIEYRLLARDRKGNETTLPLRDHPMYKFRVISFSGEPILYVAMRRSREVSVIDTGLGEEVARIPTGGESPLGVVLSSDSRYLFVSNTGSDQGGLDNRVTVIETATHQVVKTIEVGLGPLDLVVSPNGRWIYVTNSKEESISVIDIANLQEVRRLFVDTLGEGPFGIAISGDGQLLYVTDIEANRVLVLDVEKGTLLKQIKVVASPRSMVLSRGGDLLYVAGFDGGISVVDTKIGTTIKTILSSPAQGIFRMALSLDGKRLYATDPLDANLIVVDLETGKVVEVNPTWSGGRNTRDLAISPDGRVVYVANQDSNDLLFFDVATSQFIQSLKIGDGPRGIALRVPPISILKLPLDDLKRADFDGSGHINFNDFLLFVMNFGRVITDHRFQGRFDLNSSGQIDFADFLLFAGVFGQIVE